MKKAIYFILLCFLCGTMFPAFLQAQENRKGSWLPDGNPLEGNQEITAFLKSLGGSFRPMLELRFETGEISLGGIGLGYLF